VNDVKILNKLKSYIQEARDFLPRLKNYNYVSNYGASIDLAPKIRKWEYNSANILCLRFGKDNQFLQKFEHCIQNRRGLYYQENVSAALASLEHVYECLSEGLTEDLFYQRELLLFSDLLKQAEEFFSKKHYLASAIYGRLVLEATIKEFAAKKKIDTTNRKFDQIIIDLRKDSHIHEPFENSLRANYKIGSLAAHGDEKFNNLSDSEIREYLSFIRDRVLTLN
jgi:hypothetical protein